ncbi:MAG TPA: hypothetical protein PK059_05750 [Cyclobacteriaceae bacterium]|nr:hypothetical protein [Cyclobacteriaceae bacterium]
MELSITTGRKLYAICMAGLGIQQLFYLDFRPVFAPDSSWLPGLPIVAALFSFWLIISGFAMFIERRGKSFALMLGTVFLLLFAGYHVPHLLFINPYGRMFGAWVNALKELALAGGAFAFAQSYGEDSDLDALFLFNKLSSMAPWGKVFFSWVMLLFGVTHFVYTDFAAKLVPAWIPGAFFWTYVSGIALIGSGTAIILRIRVKEIGFLLGLMIFLWFILLHLPRAIADPWVDKGNELTSAFQALGFSGIALIISGLTKQATIPKNQQN